MTERFTDRGLSVHPDQEVGLMTADRKVSVIPASAIVSGKESGVLKADTNGFVRVKTYTNGRPRFFSLGIIELGEDMQVVLSSEKPNPPELGLIEGAVAISFVPDSEKRSKSFDAWKKAHGNKLLDGDAIIASREAIWREDMRLAKEFMSGREELLEEHDIDLAQVAGVEITVGII